MASEKNIKPIAIKTKSIAPGSQYIWNPLLNIDNFIRDIETPEIDIKTKESLDKLISGIPTPFARAKMFSYAIRSVGEGIDESRDKGLMAYYKTLVDEWKGLVGCLALESQPLTVEKISLSYSDLKVIDSTVNLFEPKGFFGNMLFDDKILWCDQNVTQEKQIPYILVIRYNGVLIGGTSPDSFLFTAPKYEISTRLEFYSRENKRFIDPLTTNLNSEQYEKLYVYVKHIQDSITNYIDFFKIKKPDTVKIAHFLEIWAKEIKESADKKGLTFNEKAIVPNFSGFEEPFSRLFNFKTQLYGYFGRITSNKDEFDEDYDLIEVELSELLLDPNTSTVAEILFDDSSSAENYAMHYLKCETNKGFKYFTLPLSEKGLSIFQDHIKELLTRSGDFKSHLSSVYDFNNKTLKVTLSVDVNGDITSFDKIYKNLIRIEGKNIIVWPNFISQIWNKYYLYSEIPHNSPELKAYPLRADRKKYMLLSENIKGSYKFKKIAVNGKSDDKDSASLLIEYDINKFGIDDLKYEIYESENPFKGIEFQYKNMPCGYLIAKNINMGSSFLDFRNFKNNLNPIKVGFDFGSNNTCISYSPENESNPKLLEFKNRRIFLLGTENVNDLTPAAPHEVFFFQNEITRSNQLKSMVMTHDDRRIKGIEKGPSVTLINQVKGGFPVFEKNIPVDDMTDTSCIVKMGNQKSFIKYNMKWSSDSKENAYKQGFLRILWLKTYAELLDKEYFPKYLIWAFPSSMNKQIINQYNIYWSEVAKVNPLIGIENSTQDYPNAVASQYFAPKIKNVGIQGGMGRKENILNSTGNTIKSMTEAEAVCRHASYGLTLNDNSLAIGFDIGGSTTDILCLINKYEKINDIKKTTTSLIKQSSIKFAAGILANATRKSKKFHQLLKLYCIKKGFNIHGINISPEKLNANTSPYYYNMVIDRLETKEELRDFYRNIASECQELFTINAFITGLIMFYAGQLTEQIRKIQTIKPEDFLQPIEYIDIGFYGKGGRMYDWFTAIDESAANQYYINCFGEGYGPNASEHLKYVNYFPSEFDKAKAEVSFGLSLDAEINTESDKIFEIVGEEGYKFNNSLLEPSQEIEPEYFNKMGKEFSIPAEFKRFSDFIKIFYETCHDSFGFNYPNIHQDLKNMRLSTYIMTIPEYQLAKKAEEFDFVAPMIILEGMCYLDTILMNKLFS